MPSWIGIILWYLISALLSAFDSVLSEIDLGSLLGSFFGLLIPGLITVIGSYLLYVRRQRDSKENLRAALRSEIDQMDALDSLTQGLNNLSPAPPAGKIPPSKLPPSGVFPTKVYDGSVHRLGLLDEEVQGAVVEFYSGVANQKAIIEEIRAQNQIPDADHKELYERVPELKKQRERLLLDLDADP